jgi:hypothetical protein
MSSFKPELGAARGIYISTGLSCTPVGYAAPY